MFVLIPHKYLINRRCWNINNCNALTTKGFADDTAVKQKGGWQNQQQDQRREDLHKLKERCEVNKGTNVKHRRTSSTELLHLKYRFIQIQDESSSAWVCLMGSFSLFAQAVVSVSYRALVATLICTQINGMIWFLIVMNDSYVTQILDETAS